MPPFRICETYCTLSVIAAYKQKYNNEIVLYRGECNLHKSLSPSIVRTYDETQVATLEVVKRDLCKDNDFLRLLQIDNDNDVVNDLAIESLLQHYGAKTFCVDFVDNHWVALWFALNKYDSKTNSYYPKEKDNTSSDCILKINVEWGVKDGLHPSAFDRVNNDCKELGIQVRPENLLVYMHTPIGVISDEKKEKYSGLLEKTKDIKIVELCKQNKDKRIAFRNDLMSKLCGYILLYRTGINYNTTGVIFESDDCYAVDLRRMLGNEFVRPTAQHGWIVRGKRNDFDYSKHVIAILSIDTALIKEWLGKGKLLSQENFFTNTDEGYIELLHRQKNNKYSRMNAHIPCNFIPFYN